MKKKILFLYASYGGGHKIVAEYLYDYFQKNNHNKYELYLFDIMDYSNSLGNLSVKIFDQNFKHKGNFAFNTFYEVFNHRITTIPYRSVIRMLFTEELINKIIEINPDILVSSHFFASIIMNSINKKYLLNTKIVTIITDYYSHQIWLKNKNDNTYYIVPNLLVKKQLIKNNIKEELIYPYGIPLSDRFKDLNLNKEEIKKKYNINNDKPIYLFFGGGSIGATFTYDYLKEVLKQELDINIIFISGKNEKLEYRARYLVKSKNYKNVTVLGFTSDVPELMFISDLIITKPGALNITEALEMKRPLILIPGNGGQENYNAIFVKKNGYGDYCKNPKELAKLIKKMQKNVSFISKVKKNMLLYKRNESISDIYNLVNKILEGK